MNYKTIVVILLFLLMSINSIFSQNQRNIKNENQILLQEIEKMKQSIAELESKIKKNKNRSNKQYKEQKEFNPFASTLYDSLSQNKVYKKEGDFQISIGGYGEFQYTFLNPNVRNLGDLINNPSNEIQFQREEDRQSHIFDVRRLVLYFGFKFNKWIVFNSEIEVEHASEIFVEFMYLDFLLSPYANIRAGLLLVPMGMINGWHESIAFLGSNRPYTETWLIPSTWRELGFSIYGSYKGFSYTIALITSLEGTQFGKNDTGLRAARQGGIRALATDFAGSIQLRYQIIPQLLIGISGYVGSTDHNKIRENSNLLTTIEDFHLDFRYKGVYLRALLAHAYVQDAHIINGRHLRESSDDAQIGSHLLGAYIELGYDILQEVKATRQNFIIFSRYEFIDTEFVAANGFTALPHNREHIVTIGIVYKPIIQVAIKIDYEIHLTAPIETNRIYRNRAKLIRDSFNINFGFSF